MDDPKLTRAGHARRFREVVQSMARNLAIALALQSGAGAVVGCGTSAAGGQAPRSASADSDADDASGLMEHDRYHHHGGVTLFIAMGLDTLGLSPEQRAAVQEDRSDLHAGMEAARLAENTLLARLADDIVAARFDPVALNAAVEQVRAASATSHAACADALNRLHAVLTSAQRAALVDKVEAHWRVWQKANPDEVGSAKTEASGQLAMLERELVLTAEQLMQARARLEGGLKAVPRLDHEEIESHLRAFGEAFRSERFDARALVTENEANVHLAGWGAAHLIEIVIAVGPVLTAGQRGRLAEILRAHAAHDPSAQGSS